MQVMVELKNGDTLHYRGKSLQIIYRDDCSLYVISFNHPEEDTQFDVIAHVAAGEWIYADIELSEYKGALSWELGIQ